MQICVKLSSVNVMWIELENKMNKEFRFGLTWPCDA